MYTVASKCGFDVFNGQGRVTNSAAHIKEYIEGTIERLGFSPDLYYLHRIDPSMFLLVPMLHAISGRDCFSDSFIFILLVDTDMEINRHPPRRIHHSSRRNPQAGKNEIYRIIRVLGEDVEESL